MEGKAKSFYLNKEASDLISDYTGNNSVLISNLIVEHFSNDLEKLQNEYAEKEYELELLKIKIGQRLEKVEKDQKKQDLDNITKIEDELKSQENEALTNKIKDLFSSDQITEEQYFYCFIDGKLNTDRANEVITKLGGEVKE